MEPLPCARTQRRALSLAGAVQVVLMAFECPHCGARNNEVQMGGLIPDKGVRFELRVERGDTKVRRGRRKPRLQAADCAPASHRLDANAAALHPPAQSLSRQVVKGDTCTAKARPACMSQ